MLLSQFLKNFSQNSGGFVLRRALVLAKYPSQKSYKLLESICPTVKYITMSTLPSREDLTEFLQRDGNQVGMFVLYSLSFFCQKQNAQTLSVHFIRGG